MPTSARTGVPGQWAACKASGKSPWTHRSTLSDDDHQRCLNRRHWDRIPMWRGIRWALAGRGWCLLLRGSRCAHLPEPLQVSYKLKKDIYGDFMGKEAKRVLQHLQIIQIPTAFFPILTELHNCGFSIVQEAVIPTVVLLSRFCFTSATSTLLLDFGFLGRRTNCDRSAK